MIYEFDAELKKLEGKIPWTVFYIPFSVKEVFGSNSRVPVDTFIDGYQFEGLLLPSRNGHYMVFNQDIKKVISKSLGDIIHVKLEKKVELSALVTPHIIIDKLKQDNELLSLFESMSHYLKKEEINKIMSAKKEETRMNRLDKLIIKLNDIRNKSDKSN